MKTIILLVLGLITSARCYQIRRVSGLHLASNRVPVYRREIIKSESGRSENELSYHSNILQLHHNGANLDRKSLSPICCSISDDSVNETSVTVTVPAVTVTIMSSDVNVTVPVAETADPVTLASATPQLSSALTSSVTASSKSPLRSKVSWLSPHGRDNELVREVLAGIVTSLATLPTSIAYASLIGLNPLLGIWSSAILGLSVAAVGGGPGLIAGAAGVVAIPISKLVASHGYQYIAPTIFLAAIIELFFGFCKLSKIADVVTEPVIAGFLNAFAMFLVKSQMKVFRSAPSLQAAVAIAGACAAIIQITPRFTKVLPPTLVGIILSSLLGIGMNLPLKAIRDIAVLKGGWQALPSLVTLQVPLLSLQTLSIVGSTAIGVAVIAILETLLASRIACDAYRCRADIYEEDDPDRVMVGLGVGTALTGLAGGFGGCGLIPNTILNGKSGGEGYASAYSYSLFLAFSAVFLSPLMGRIPMASLAGLMLTVASNTFEWKETKHLFVSAWKGRGNLEAVSNLLAMLTTFALCIKVDMGLGVLAGVLVAKVPAMVQHFKKPKLLVSNGNSA